MYSSLGWILYGPIETGTMSLVCHVLTVSGEKSCKSKLDEQLKEFWDLESFGVKNEDDTLYEQFKLNVSFDGERYQVSLPWRDTVFKLPDNYQLSVKRVHNLLRRLKQQPELLKENNKAICEQIGGE